MTRYLKKLGNSSHEISAMLSCIVYVTLYSCLLSSGARVVYKLWLNLTMIRFERLKAEIVHTLNGLMQAIFI